MRLLFVLAILAVSCSVRDLEPQKVSAFKVKWHTFSEGHALALQTKKLIFMDVFADWCYPCKVMDHEVFNQKEISDYLDKNFISIRVDYENDIPLACGGKLKDAKLCLDEDWRASGQISALPFLAILSSDGRRIFSHTGQINKQDLLLVLQEIVLEYD